MDATPSQLKTISYIENNLGLVFKGSTKTEARDFISKHISDSYRFRGYKQSLGSIQTTHTDRREVIQTLFPNSGYIFDEDDDWARPY